jgi:formylglycine-generating enzyme required for sulfatase activity
MNSDISAIVQYTNHYLPSRSDGLIGLSSAARSRLQSTWVALLVFLSLWLALSAEGVVIDFEDLKAPGNGTAGLRVGDQYAALGITFPSYPTAFDYSQGSPPLIGFAHSGSKAVELCHGIEFCYAPLRMEFATLQSHIRVWVGYSGTEGFGWPHIIILRGYDPDNNEVGHAIGWIEPCSGVVNVTIPVELALASPSVSRATLGFLNAESQQIWNSQLVIDDVEFDHCEGPPPPCPDTELVWICPGTFTMGSPENEPGRLPGEGPQTTVTISQGFFMGKYEVTQAEYEAVMGENPSTFKGDPSRPVERVSWSKATDYCSQLTSRQRAAGCLPPNYEYRLPTDAQWEYACRAGTTTRFSFGDLDAALDAYGWYVQNSTSSHPVGQRAPNPWALYDMHGNVTEWCADWYASSLPGGSVTDPQGPATGSGRVVRGGGWGLPGNFCRSACRSWHDPNGPDSLIGFRVVLVAVP